MSSEEEQQTPSTVLMPAESAAVASAAVYCLCRGVDDGSDMVECDRCKDWYHYYCVGIVLGKKRKSLAASIGSEDAQYVCMGCCTLTGQPYVFKW
jgi:hypothetical protein